MYYYHDGENEVGPFSVDKLRELNRKGLIGDATLVRASENSPWTPLNQILKDQFYRPFESADVEEGKLEVGLRKTTVVDSEIRNPSAALLSAEYEDATEPDASGSKPFVSPAGWLAQPPTPWRRYGARILDTTLNGQIVFFLFGIAFYAISPASADSFFSIFESESAYVLDLILTSFAASILSGSLIGVSGFTLGKFIFGVKVTRIDGKKLGLWAGLSRDFLVYLKGLGLGIPLVALFTAWIGYKKLTDDGSTSWDEGRYIVWHRPSGVSQTILNIIGVIIILIIVAVYRAILNET